jgi:hypothetical protein
VVDELGDGVTSGVHCGYVVDVMKMQSSHALCKRHGSCVGLREAREVDHWAHFFLLGPNKSSRGIVAEATFDRHELCKVTGFGGFGKL